jgi:hypothetical protein
MEKRWQREARGKQKEDSPGELEKQLQHLQESFK